MEILPVIRLRYTSIKNPLLNDIHVHVYQTYPNKLDGDYKDYNLADLQYIRKTTPEGKSYDFIRIYFSADSESNADFSLQIWDSDSYIEYDGKKYRTEQDLLKLHMIVNNLRALYILNRLE